MKKVILNNLRITTYLTLFFKSWFLYSGFYSSFDWTPQLDTVKKTLKREMEKDSHVKGFAFGVGGADAVCSFKMITWYFDEVSTSVGKELLLQQLDRMLYEINTFKPIRPSMKTYPFTLSNVKTSICFFKENTKDVEEGAMTYITLWDDCFDVTFYHKDLRKTDYYRSPIHLYFQNNPEAKTKYPNVWSSLKKSSNTDLD